VVECPQSQDLKADFDKAVAAVLYNSDAVPVLAGTTPEQGAIIWVWVLYCCEQAAVEILNRIGDVPISPERIKKQMRIAQREYLTSFPAKLTAAIRVLGLKCVGGKQGQPVTLGDVLAIAYKIDVSKPCQEPIRAFWEPKDNGDFRPLCDFGPQRRIQHTLLSDALLAAGVDSEFDFTRRGAGNEIGFRDEVIKALEDGYDWWWTADVANCFTSLKPGHFKGFHIDRIIMRNVAYIPKCAKVMVLQKGSPALLGYLESAYPDLMATHATLAPNERMRRVTIDIVRRGLPQGSCLSIVLARAFIGRELRKMLEHYDGRPVCWIDDLAIGFDTKKSAKAAEGFLLEQLLQQPAGQVQLHKLRLIRSKHAPHYVLGYEFEPGRGYNGTPVHVKPSRKRTRRFKNRLTEKLVTRLFDNEELELEEALQIGESYARQWYGSMKAWTKVPNHSKSLCLFIAEIYVRDDYAWLEQELSEQ
jgi:hypothetical protein